MFAALCENSDFFTPKMERFIALAPVVRVKNMESQFLKSLAEDPTGIKALEAIGPEIMF